MFNPATVFTPDSLNAYHMHIFNMKKALSFILNHADDLHIGSSEEGDKILQSMYDMQEHLNSSILKEGDGETYDD